MFPSHRNQSVDFQSKSTDWFLYEGSLDVKYYEGSQGLNTKIGMTFP